MKVSSLAFLIAALMGTSLQAQSIKQFVPEAVQKFVPDIVIGDDDDKLGSHDKKESMKTIHGPADLEDQTFKSLTIIGPADLDDVTVKDKLDVTGPLTGKDLNIENLHVIGPLSLEKSEIGTGNVTGPTEFNKSVIKGKLTVIGPLKGANSQFHKEITVHTNRMKLKNSQTQNIKIIAKDIKEEGLSLNIGKHIKLAIGDEDVEVEKLKNKPAILHVEGKSTISGNVTFEGRKGLVILSSGSTLKGKVINGDVRQAK